MQDTIWANDGETKICNIADLPWVESPATGRRSSDFDTEQANARLIALAPELLGLAKDGALQFARLQGEQLEAYAKTFAVLAKGLIAKAQNQGGAL